MDKLLQGDAERYASAHKRKRRWYQVTTCLAAVVVFCTTYALILPAITLEKQCEIPEHTHTEACYTSERGDLICTQSTEPQHTHTEECYQETRDLVCGMSESTGHTHGAECYDQEGNLICGQEESEGHVHGEACYEASRQLICGQTEEPAHQHTEECYSWNQVLTCGMEEHTHSEACTATEPEEPEEPEEPVFCGKEPHTHGEDCRDEQGELTCTLEEHTHSLACYADPGADVETAEIWEQTFGDVTLTGDWRLDALAIAQSQLGYAESTKNYVLAEDGQTLMGYTRYGAWQGDPYGHWNAMFVAFCLHYGGAENVPMDTDCGSWPGALADGFLPAQSHQVAPGDLVFFDRDGDGTADRVAIVAEVTAGEEAAPSGFTAIEGDVDHAVQQCSYAAEDPTILGYYGSLPEQAKTFTLTAQTGSGITVTVTGDSASLPFPASEITLTAADVAEEQGQAIREQLPAEEDTEPEQRFLLDITLWHGEEEIEPVGPVTVTFSGLDTEGLYPKVYHIDTEAQEVTDMEAEKTETGDVAMVTEHFSTYAISFAAARDLTGTIGEDAFLAGGEYKLTGDVQTAENIGQVTITTDTTIDLNGHTLTISKANQCFVVQSGAKLTIKDDSKAPEETVTPDGGDLCDNTASLENDTLTYYITESEANGTGTTETLIKHEVPLAGKILCKEASEQAILVKGTLELQSGVLQGTGGKHIVYVDGGTLDVKGGYIVGGGSEGTPGGGIYINGGTVNIQGGVVAANRGRSGGGIFVNSGELNISGGAVAGNEVIKGHEDNGGGIYVNSSGTLNLSGGYVTNNSKDCVCEICQGDKGNTHGGGGIALANGSTMNMSGGYVTGNYSSLAGGGIYAGFYAGDGGVNFSMTGGTIASNCAELGEGGGLRIGGGTKGVIRADGADGKVYITNNHTLTKDDWGGGGIFVQQGGLLSVMDALITDNSAGGFGGGVGACPTGETLIVNKDGAAIYGNTASGKNMSEGGNGKHYDSSVAEASPVFMAKGYTDYFCVRERGIDSYISLVTGLMAGGGAANWTGSCDEQPVKIGRTGYAAAKYLFGLVANPDESAKNSAVAYARVMITGNSSGVHGGGIMTNGGLILGDPDGSVVTATPELDITGTKALVKDGEPQNSGLKDFQFQLKDSDGKVVGTATADDTTGEFTIEDIKFTQTGDYTYTLSEIKGNRTDVTYDTKKYKIDVTISTQTITLLGVDFTSYYVKSVSVDGKEVGGSSGSGGDSQTGTFRVRFRKEEGWENLHMHVWADPNNPLTTWPGIQMKKDDTDGSYYYDLPVTGRGIYNYVFNIGSDAKKTKDITNVPYAPGKEAEFDADGNVLSNTAADTSSTETGGGARGSNPDGSYSLVMEGDTFTNTMTTPLNLQITKTDSVNTEKLLEGAIFTLTKVGTENPESPLTGTTNKDGIATFANIQRGATYYLHETKAPSGYMTAGPWILDVKERTATLYPATEGENGTLTKSSDTGTQLEGSDSDPIVFSATISDQSWGYKLPDTGGAGTTSYTAGGLTLIFGAATLLYIHCKRRKEDEVSS